MVCVFLLIYMYYIDIFCIWLRAILDWVSVLWSIYYFVQADIYKTVFSHFEVGQGVLVQSIRQADFVIRGWSKIIEGWNTQYLWIEMY